MKRRGTFEESWIGRSVPARAARVLQEFLENAGTASHGIVPQAVFTVHAGSRHHP